MTTADCIITYTKPYKHTKPFILLLLSTEATMYHVLHTVHGVHVILVFCFRSLFLLHSTFNNDNHWHWMFSAMLWVLLGTLLWYQNSFQAWLKPLMLFGDVLSIHNLLRSANWSLASGHWIKTSQYSSIIIIIINLFVTEILQLIPFH